MFYLGTAGWLSGLAEAPDSAALRGIPKDIPKDVFEWVSFICTHSLRTLQSPAVGYPAAVERLVVCAANTLQHTGGATHPIVAGKAVQMLRQVLQAGASREGGGGWIWGGAAAHDGPLASILLTSKPAAVRLPARHDNYLRSAL